MKAWLQLGAVTVAAGWLLAARSEAGSSDVYRLQTTITGVTNENGVPLTDTQLINLGLHQAPNTPVPASTRLGLVTQCASNDMRIIVYDKAMQSNLVTIGSLKTVSVVESLKGKRYTRNVISELTFNFAPTNSSNDSLGGRFFASGSLLSDSNQCFLSYHATSIGSLTNSSLNISKTALSAGGKKLGTLIEP